MNATTELRSVRVLLEDLAEARDEVGARAVRIEVGEQAGGRAEFLRAGQRADQGFAHACLVSQSAREGKRSR